MPRIAIIGPGAIGSVLTALLHQTGRHELLLCARRAIDRLCVETPTGRLEFLPKVATAPAQVQPVDWIIVATKAYDSDSAAAWIPPLAVTGAPLAIAQNGVEHRERFAGVLSPDRLVPVMVDLPAERTETGVVQRGPARLVVADGIYGRAFVELFHGTPADVSVTSDLKSAVWRKLCLNAAGVVSALVDQPARIMRTEAAVSIARALVREAIAVGRAEGAVLPDEVEEWVLRCYRAAPPDSVNSLHADRRAGRPTEIDARNGVIVRLGRTYGIATPYNAMAVELITVISSRA